MQNSVNLELLQYTIYTFLSFLSFLDLPDGCSKYYGLDMAMGIKLNMSFKK